MIGYQFLSSFVGCNTWTPVGSSVKYQRFFSSYIEVFGTFIFLSLCKPLDSQVSFALFFFWKISLLCVELIGCFPGCMHFDQVLDEADRLLNEEFEKSLDEILNVIPRDRKTYLFSATMTKKVSSTYVCTILLFILIQVLA